MSNLRPRLLAFLIAPAVLAACSNNTPNEAAFLQNATQLMSAQSALLGTSPADVCLPVNFTGDLSSNGLADGWVAYSNEPASVVLDDTRSQSYSLNTRQDAIQKLAALESAGVVEKQPYELYQGGVLKPGFRYQLTQVGRDAVIRKGSWSTCLSIGHWEPKAVVPPRSAVETKDSKLIVQKDVGDTPSYEAWVSYELKGRPAWAKNPQLEAVFTQELGATKTDKLSRLELVKINGKWLAKELILRQMSRGSSLGDRSLEAKILPIPKDLEDAALAKLSASLSTGYGRVTSIPFPSRASETPSQYAISHQGHFFFATTPDPLAADRADVNAKQARFAELESRVNALPPTERASQLAGLENERKRVAASVRTDVPIAERDRYLNQRKMLQELLDSLVTAGAYQKRTVAEGEIPGSSVLGALYSPVAGVAVTLSGLDLGTIAVKGPLKQEGMSTRMLQVSATYSYTDVPEWAQALAKTNPGIGRRLKGGVVRAVAVAHDSGEFPYRIEAQQLN